MSWRLINHYVQKFYLYLANLIGQLVNLIGEVPGFKGRAEPNVGVDGRKVPRHALCTGAKI